MTYATEVLADLPLSWWDLRQASGAVQSDRSGNGRTGTIVGSPTLDPTDGITFNPSSDQHIESDANFAAGTYGAWAIEVVCEAAGFANFAHLCGFQSGAGPDYLAFAISSVPQTSITWYGTSGHGLNGATTPLTATRYHFVAEFDGAEVRIFVNGVLDGSASETDGAVLSYGQPLYVGNDGFGIGDGFDGLIRHAAFYDHALGATRVAAHATAALTDDPLNPTIHLPFVNLTQIFAPAIGRHAAPGETGPLLVRVVDIHGVPHTASGLIGGALPLAKVQSITRNHNAPDEAVISFPKYAYTRDDVHVFADDSGSGDLHEIQVIRNGKVRFWGPAISDDAHSGPDGGEVTLQCRGVDWYLSRRFLDAQRTNLLTNPSFETGDETGWTFEGSVDHEVTTDDAIRGTHSLRLASITPDGDIFATQSFTVTGTGVGTLITVSAYFKMESNGGHALGRRGLYVEGLESGVVKDFNFYAIDEGTFEKYGSEWVRAKTTLEVPPNKTWVLRVRPYSAPGSMLWDDLQAVAMQSVSTAGLTGSIFTPVDVSRIFRMVHIFVQDPSVGKSDLAIGMVTPTVGVKQVKHIQWASHVPWTEQMAEWLDRDDCFDYSIRKTATTRSMVLHVPTRGVDRTGTVTLAYKANVASYSFAEDGGGTITDDTVLADDTGDGPDREEGHYAAATEIGGLVLQNVEQAPQNTEVNSLDPLARDKVTHANRPAEVWTLTIVNNDGTDYVELLDIGDKVTFSVPDGWVQGGGQGKIVKLVEYPSSQPGKLDVTLNKAA